FKVFNDRFGHPEGDRLLFSIGTLIRRIAGAGGLVSRYGGEEFTVIFDHLPTKEAFEIAESIRLQLENTRFAGLSSNGSYMTLSGGLATFPETGKNTSELIESADRALYQAKRQGRNQIVVATKK